MTASPSSRADLAVHGDAHGVAGRVQRLRADDDRVHVELELVRVPAALVDPAEQAERHDRVDAAAVEHAVLAVGRERHVLRAQRPAGADLGGLLAEQARPDAQLALALQRGGLGVQLPDDDQVAVEVAVFLVGEVDRVVGVFDPVAIGGEQLHELRFGDGVSLSSGFGLRALRHASLPVVLPRQRGDPAGARRCADRARPVGRSCAEESGAQTWTPYPGSGGIGAAQTAG